MTCLHCSLQCLLLTCILCTLTGCSQAEETIKKHTKRAVTMVNFPFHNVSLPWEDRVADLVNRLTLEDIQDQMAKGRSGGNKGPAKAIARLGIGQYQWSTECLRGSSAPGAHGTSYPQALGLAAAFSPDLIFKVAEATGVEVRGHHKFFVEQNNYEEHTGLSCFSPVINIMRDPRWGRNQETYGEDPFLSGEYAAAFVQGLQGNHSRYVRASAGCKHFDAYAGPENIPVSRFLFDARVSERDWRTTFLPAFRRCVEAGTYSLMCSYNKINGVPACADETLLTDILRTEWGFRGYVVSDGGALDIINGRHVFNTTTDTVAACVNAGCNLELPGDSDFGPVYLYMLEAIKQNKLTEAKVREMVKPLFYTRMRLGEFDPPEMNPYSKLSLADVETAEHRALTLEAAMQTFVLLKNNGVLPLHKTGTIGVVGPMANNEQQLLGTYPAVPTWKYMISPLEGLTPLASKVQYASGCDDTVCKTYNSSAVRRAVSGTDINFVVLGTGQAVEAEGQDRPDTELPGHQKTLLQDVISNTPSNTPIVLLLFNAGPVNISFADQDPRVSAIMECFFPAQATGDALRHVLLNDVKGAVPAGRLPFTWPLLASQIPPMVNYSMQGRTYRYFEGDPLYPFGYGLSYTTFEYTASVHTTTVRAGQPLTGSFWIRNTGTFEADEVTQVYIAWHNNTVPAPKLQLVWFKRYSLPTGGADIKVDFEVEARSMALWFDDGWHVKEGTMDIFIGGQQPNQARNSGNSAIHAQIHITGSAYLGKY